MTKGEYCQLFISTVVDDSKPLPLSTSITGVCKEYRRLISKYCMHGRGAKFNQICICIVYTSQCAENLILAEGQ